MPTRPRGRVTASLAPRRKPAVRPEPDREPEDPWTAMRQDGVLWRAYALAARHLVRLLPPALLVFLPIGLLTSVALALLVDGSAAVINGDLAPVGPPGASVLVWAAATLMVLMAGQALALPGTVVLAAGRLTGKHVSVSAAMRAAVRRWPAATALVLVTMPALAVAASASAVVLLLPPEAQVVAFIVPAALALAATPCLLAVAPLMLEDLSVRGALARAYRLTSGAFLVTTLTVLFGVLLVPALVTWAAGRALDGVPVASFAAASVLTLAGVPFQAATIARQFLNRMVVRGKIDAFGAVVARLPDDGPRPARPVRVLAALLLPTLLYAGAVRVNPLGWPEVAETTVAVTDPDLGPRELRSVQPGPDGHLIMLMDSGFSGGATVLTCLDGDCARQRPVEAEPDQFPDYTAAGARLADGRLVLTSWEVEDGAHEDDWRARLGLRVCDASRCSPAAGGRQIAEIIPYAGRLTASDADRTVAMAARPDGGLVVAQAYQLDQDSRVREAIVITTCDDASCTRPRTKQVASIPLRVHAHEGEGLSVAVDAAGRPTVLRFDPDNGKIFVISCDTPSCDTARVARPVLQDALGRTIGLRDLTRAAMALRPDGRPLIAYRDLGDGAIKLFDCLTRDCSRTTTTTVSDPGRHAGPALILDRHGRALVAHQDLDRDRILIATCADGRCTSTPVTSGRHVIDHGMAMTLDARGRPVVAWWDGSPDGRDLKITTLLTPAV